MAVGLQLRWNHAATKYLRSRVGDAISSPPDPADQSMDQDSESMQAPVHWKLKSAGQSPALNISLKGGVMQQGCIGVPPASRDDFQVLKVVST